MTMQGRVALVTGAASGIGRATAALFARHGASVAVSDVDREGGEQTAGMITEEGGRAVFIPCDVSDEQQVRGLVAATIDRFGRLDAACNNAGIEGEAAPTPDCTPENWRKVIDINLRGVWLCMKHEIPEMLKNQGGSIVNVSSIAGLVGFAGMPAYVASKHGVNGLTQVAARSRRR
jgi:NAD(P)-dependent dehydrogenase (short-subunit alcohol dehydrogenase family)